MQEIACVLSLLVFSFFNNDNKKHHSHAIPTWECHVFGGEGRGGGEGGETAVSHDSFQMFFVLVTNVELQKTSHNSSISTGVSAVSFRILGESVEGE